jgi:hypothetical protein
MSNSNYYTDIDNTMNIDHVYENIEINTINNDQGRNLSSYANAVYARAPMLGQYNDYEYVPRERNGKKYAYIEIIFKIKVLTHLSLKVLGSDLRHDKKNLNCQSFLSIPNKTPRGNSFLRSYTIVQDLVALEF